MQDFLRRKPSSEAKLTERQTRSSSCEQCHARVSSPATSVFLWKTIYNLRGFHLNAIQGHAYQGSSRALYTPLDPTHEECSPCTISRGWVCYADLKLSSQGYLSVELICSSGLVWRWQSDLILVVWSNDVLVWGFGGFGLRSDLMDCLL